MKTAATQPAQPPTRKKTRRPGATWGGARPGAGAKKGRRKPVGAGLPNLKDGEKSRALFFRMAESDAARVDQIATARGQKTSEFLRDIVTAFLTQ